MRIGLANAVAQWLIELGGYRGVSLIRSRADQRALRRAAKRALSLTLNQVPTSYGRRQVEERLASRFRAQHVFIAGSGQMSSMEALRRQLTDQRISREIVPIDGNIWDNAEWLAPTLGAALVNEIQPLLAGRNLPMLGAELDQLEQHPLYSLAPSMFRGIRLELVQCRIR